MRRHERKRQWVNALRAIATMTAFTYLTACGSAGNNGSAGPGVDPPPSPPPNQPPPTSKTLQGTVSGAHSWLADATVMLYRVGAAGYGTTATALGSAKSDASGAWTITFTAPNDDPLVYLTVDGGDAGRGVNSAVGLMAALGHLSRAPSRVAVNELTTVSAVYALAQFLDNATATQIAAPASNAAGLEHAFGTVANLVDPTAGTVFASPDGFTPIVNPLTRAYEAPPGGNIARLANVVAACIGSESSASSACTTYFDLTTDPSGQRPTDTRNALLTIALHPAVHVTELFALSRTPSVLFQPDLGTVAPNDWTLAINFAGGLLNNSSPTGVAIDGAGSVWVTSQHCDPQVTSSTLGCLIKMTPQGAQAGPYSASSGENFDLARGGGAITISSARAGANEIVWVAAAIPNALYAFDASDGMELFGGAMTATGHLLGPQSIAADALGNVWAMNSRSRLLSDGSTVTSLIELSPGPLGDYSDVHSFDYTTPAGMITPSFTEIALDSAFPANIFVSDAVANQLLEFNGSTPGLQSATRRFVSSANSAPGPIAIDPNGTLWAADLSGGVTQLSALSSAPVVRDFLSNTIYSPGQPGGAAIDGAGRLWVSNVDANGNKGVVVLLPDGSSVTASTAIGAFTGGAPPSGGPLGYSNVGTLPAGLAIDSAGNVWVAAGGAGGVVELVGAAVPVKTPLRGPSVRP